MSSSFFVNGMQKAYHLIIDQYYENSALNKGLKKIGQWGKNSLIVKCVTELIAKDHFTVIKNKSKVLGWVDGILQALSKGLGSLVQHSGITSLATKWVLPLKDLGVACHAICCMGTGFFATRLVVFLIQFGFSKTILLVNGGALVFFLLLSFVPVQNMAAAIKNNIVSRLIVWFFNV